ncbi:MAG: MmgE/PrpD family protein, partial [Gaiellales bacterium]
AAVAVGYEVATRIAMSMQPSPARARRVWGQQFHPFASAATAGNLLGLDAEEMDVAFGITATYATVPSAYKYFGPVRDTRPIRETKQGWGWVCMAGMMAALSAQRGFGGGLGALDGEFGFWSMASSDRFDARRALDGLGDTWLSRQIEYKLHPSIGINHPAYWATKQLVEEFSLASSEVEEITISTLWGNLLDDRAPAGPVDAQFSLPYTVASTIMRRELSPALYSGAALSDPELRRLLGVTRVLHDASADRVFYEEQRIAQAIALRLADGRVLEREVEFPRDRPAYGGDQLRDKFHTLADGVLDLDARGRTIAAVESLDQLDDVSRLVALLY